MSEGDSTPTNFNQIIIAANTNIQNEILNIPNTETLSPQMIQKI